MSITCSHDGEPPSTPPAAQTQNANPETSRKRPAVGGTPQLKPRRILHEAKTVAIGGQLFATKAQARERFKQIRDGAPASGLLTPEHEAFMIDCVSAHVKIKKWIEENDGHIERVYVGAGAKAEYGSRSVRVSMRSSRNPNLGETETVGPDPCLDGLFGVKVCRKHERHRGARLRRVRAALRGHARDGVGELWCLSVALPPPPTNRAHDSRKRGPGPPRAAAGRHPLPGRELPYQPPFFEVSRGSAPTSKRDSHAARRAIRGSLTLVFTYVVCSEPREKKNSRTGRCAPRLFADLCRLPVRCAVC